MTKKMTIQEFISRSEQVHNHYYDYSNSVLNGTKKKIKIICPIHGEFEQMVFNHLRGRGCLTCSEEKKRTPISEFIRQSRKVHGNKFDYSKVELINMNTKITIICLEHGEFEQRPADHIVGFGCITCSGNKQKTTKEFIKQAQGIHRDKFDYSLVDYKSGGSKVKILCSVHGEFKQRPLDHLRGNGCPECNPYKLVTKDMFVKKAHKRHGLRYDYSKLTVNGMMNKGTIVCPLHGEFEQRLNDHINNGSGCPQCCRENMGMYTESFFMKHPKCGEQNAKFYIVRGNVENIKFCKVGITKHLLNKRFRMKDVDDIFHHDTTLVEAWKCERYILSQFKTERFKFKSLQKIGFGGWSECFSLKLLNEIQRETENYINRTQNGQ